MYGLERCVENQKLLSRVVFGVQGELECNLVRDLLVR